MGVDTAPALSATDRMGGPRVTEARIVGELELVDLRLAFVGLVQVKRIDKAGL